MGTAGGPEPRVTRSRLLLGTLGVLLCHLLAVAALVFVFVILGGAFLRSRFAPNQDLELPADTILFINLSNFLTSYWFVLLLLLVPDALVYLFLACRSFKWNWLATAWGMFWLLATIGLLIRAVMGVITASLVP